MSDAVVLCETDKRGVATVTSEFPDAELERLDHAGIRGVRFNFVRRLVDTLPKNELATIARRIGALGWHVVVYFDAADLAEFYDFFCALPTTVIVDHMGRPDVSKSPESEEFALFMRLMRDNDNIWTKVSCPDRLSATGPPDYSDVVPFGRALVETFPDRVLWGSDWPHPNLRSHMPDDGKLVDYIPGIATTPALQRKLLVDNPLRLYWPEDAG